MLDEKCDTYEAKCILDYKREKNMQQKPRTKDMKPDKGKGRGSIQIGKKRALEP